MGAQEIFGSSFVEIENLQTPLFPSSDKMAKAMKAMKAMAAMKAMKAMKKKSVSKIAKGKFRKVLVFRGSKEKTIGGLQKSDLIKNKHGRIVSKKASLRAKKNSGWTSAIVKARKALGLKGFVAIKKGSDLYKKAKELYQ